MFDSSPGEPSFLADQFWVRWKTEYLQNQQRRSKWNERCRNLTIGDIVILKDEAHRSEWPLGKVFDAIKSKDGLVRQTKITSWKDGEKKSYLRPIYYQHHYTTEIFHCRIPADRERIVSLLRGNGVSTRQVRPNTLNWFKYLIVYRSVKAKLGAQLQYGGRERS